MEWQPYVSDNTLTMVSKIFKATGIAAYVFPRIEAFVGHFVNLIWRALKVD